MSSPIFVRADHTSDYWPKYQRRQQRIGELGTASPQSRRVSKSL